MGKKNPSTPSSQNDHTTSLTVDVTIFGAGPVGIALALLLSKQGYQCALVEKRPLQRKPCSPQHATDNTERNSFDGRTLALNIGSIELLASLDCLPEAEKTQAIEKIRISQQGHFGSCLLESERERLSCFGITVSSLDLGEKMQESLINECANNNNLRYFDGAKIKNITQNSDNNLVTASVGNDEHSCLNITSSILVAADGAESQIRQHFDFPIEVKDYHQQALLTKVVHQSTHLNTAHERFLKNGILALLPTPLESSHFHGTKNTNPSGQQVGFVSSVVWLQNAEETMSAKEWPHEKLLATLENLFGKQYGHFLNAKPCVTYPIRETVATKTHKHNVVLVGNAAHSLHPVAGQGLNLGLQDASGLSNQISLTGCNIRSLETFAVAQQQNIRNIRNFVNNLLGCFDSPHPLLALSRSFFMFGFEKCTPIRRPFLHLLAGVQQPSSLWFWKVQERLQSLY